MDFDTWFAAQREADEAIDTMLFDLLSSSDEEAEELPKHGGSKEGRAKNIDRDFPAAYAKVVKDYFSGPASTYNERQFEQRFRTPRAVFEKIHDKLMGQWPFTGPTKNCVGTPGIHPLPRLVACFRHLAYGDAYDREDENLRMSGESVRISCQQFCKLLKQEFPEYLNRCPSEEEKKKVIQANADRGFPGCFASWDCKHFVWHRCPTKWQGQHKGHAEGGKMTLILEAIADVDRYIWYANFGDAGSLNDINVLDKSSIVGAMLNGSFDTTTPEYTINGIVRDWLYFLADGIYPEWAIFVKTHSDPIGDKELTFAKRQEAVRKDVECAFGIIVQKFHILKRPLRQWYIDSIIDLLHACVIIHNMTIAHYSDNILSQEQAAFEVEAKKNKDRKWPLFGGQEVSHEVILGDGVDLFAARVATFNNDIANERDTALPTQVRPRRAHLF